LNVLGDSASTHPPLEQAASASRTYPAPAPGAVAGFDVSGDPASTRPAPGPFALVIPVLDEARALPRLLRHLALLDPPPAEIVLVDGGSADGTAELAAAAGLRVLHHGARGRAAQINRGVAEVAAPLVLVLHADTLLPDDALAVAERALADPRVSLAGFIPIICGPETTRWATTAHNWAKTWYAPLLFRPRLFLRGGRLLFGDHAMFFRRADFLAVGGCDERLRVMEDADLCLRLSRLGRIRLVNRTVLTSDRRVAAWGEWRANWIYLRTGLRWALGRREQLGPRDYPDIR